jgi:hypothetical protein
MKKTTRRVTVPKRLQRVQAEAERVIGRGYKATLELLPAGSRKAVKELASQVETTAGALTKRSQAALKAMEKQRKALLGRVGKAVRTFERNRERAFARVEVQSNKLAAAVEHRAAQVVKPLVRRFDIAAASELEKLSKRLAQVERKLAGGRRAAA